MNEGAAPFDLVKHRFAQASSSGLKQVSDWIAIWLSFQLEKNSELISRCLQGALGQSIGGYTIGGYLQNSGELTSKEE